MSHDKTRQPRQPETAALDKGAGYPALELDYALYEQYLKDSEWTEDQKREFIDTLWSIVVQFVDLGIGVHPVQTAVEDDDIRQSLLAPSAAQSTTSQEHARDRFLPIAEDGAHASGERNCNDE